ncbi:MAG: hemerythrin family protein [Magnetococcus sp. DMHC-1]|nr:hemerythrin family protein [Magnetococcales bacterium]
MNSSLWDDKYAIGIESIDTHHKNLVQTLDDLVLAAACQDAEKVREVFQAVEEYVLEHFRDEELLMARAGYPDLDGHHLLHAQFRLRFHKIAMDFTAGRVPETIVALQHALYGWLFHHIYHVDQDYRPWVIRLQNQPSS